MTIDRVRSLSRRGGVRLVVGGVVLGGIVALWSGRWVASLLFHESPTDPAVYTMVAVVLVGVSLVASLVPALSAARVDPNIALRAD